MTQEYIQMHLDHEYCDTLGDIKSSLYDWCKNNKDCTFVSHSVCLDSRSYLLTIVYYYKD